MSEQQRFFHQKNTLLNFFAKRPKKHLYQQPFFYKKKNTAAILCTASLSGCSLRAAAACPALGLSNKPIMDAGDLSAVALNADREQIGGGDDMYEASLPVLRALQVWGLWGRWVRVPGSGAFQHTSPPAPCAPCTRRAVLKKPDFFLIKDSPKGQAPGTTNAKHQPPPTANRQPPPTANRQPPTANRRQPPTANRRQPPTANRRPLK